MNPTLIRFQRFLALALWTLAAQTACVSAAPPPAPEASGSNTLYSIPTRPAGSPIDTFRKLLAMSREEQEQFLTNYPADKRKQILKKVDEYQTLPPEIRELKLRVTELRWYLLPLLQAPRQRRPELLKSVPPPYQELIASRLQEWDVWPPALQDEVLKYETTMHYVVGGSPEAAAQMSIEEVPEADRPATERKLAEWRAMSPEQRRQLYGAFHHYFELSEPEQQRILATLSEPEREETEKVVNSIEKWPKDRQDAYMAAFRKYAEMSPVERYNFLKNAERWQKMSLAERQAWRDLIRRLPESPPLPAGFFPHAQPAGPSAPPAIKTNTAPSRK